MNMKQKGHSEEQSKKQIKGQSKKQIKGQLEKQIKGQAEKQMKEQPKEQMAERLKKQVKEQSKEQIAEQLKKQMKEQSKEQMKKQAEKQSKERIKEQIKEVEQLQPDQAADSTFETGKLIERMNEDRMNYMEMNVPDEGLRRMQEAIEQAKRVKRQRRHMYRRIYTGMAAAFAVICLLPNCSRASAQVLQELPVFGHFFEVITIRDYQFDDGHSSADVQIPRLESSADGLNDASAADLNQSIEEYTEQILDRFKENQKIIGDQGHQSLNISYDVLTNTDRWFTLEIIVDEVQGSGYEYKRYYHIDKSTGKIAALKDLFEPGSSYLAEISSYIEKQMKKYNKESEEGSVYWIGTSEVGHGYEGIGEDQNFYLNKNNELVIVFDEYDVAPGYMGTPEFVIPQKLIAGMRKF